MAAHNLGMAEMAGSLPEMVRQFAAAGRREEEGVDALTAHQVEKRRRALTPARDHRAVRKGDPPGRPRSPPPFGRGRDG